MHTRWNLSRNSDDAVIAALDDLVRTENQHVSDVLAHFAEVDVRELFADRGYSSMFRYAVEHLGWSEGAARHRITAARAARRFPVIFEHVAAGAIHLSGLNVLATHLTDDNHVALLDAARRMSKRQIEELIAAEFPKSDVLAMVVPQPPPPGEAAPHGQHAPASGAPANGPSASAAGVGTPLSAASFSVTVTISRDGRDKLVEAQALLRHSIPNGDLGAIVERAIDALLANVRKQKFAETATPRARRGPGESAPDSRHIPADVKREVAKRDDRRCTFVADDGRRCDEIAWLEYHHQQPFGRGGPPTADNVTLHCATHNALRARRDYGRDHIERRRNERHDRARDRVPDRAADLGDEAVADAQAALCQAGFSRTIARRAVTRAAAELDAQASLEQIVRLSLRHTRTAR